MDDRTDLQIIIDQLAAIHDLLEKLVELEISEHQPKILINNSDAS